MSHLHRTQSRAQDIQEMASAIRDIGRLVNEDLVRRCSADAKTGAPLQPFLGETELGGLMLAVEHLSSSIEAAAEAMEDEERRLAEISAEREDREGRP